LTPVYRVCDETADAAWLLTNELKIFQAEAQARWLDHCEAQLAAGRHALPDATTTTATEVAR